MMRIEKKDSSAEKRILTAMITDKGALATISAHWQPPGLFQNKWANIVGAWCIKYFVKYEIPPRQEIEALFARWAEDAKDETAVKLVETFLSGLSEEYEKESAPNADFIADLAAQHFNRVRMVRAMETAQRELENGDDAKALACFQEFSRVEFGAGAGIDVLRDRAAIKSAFAGIGEDIVSYPEAVGNFFRGNLTRDSFIVFMGTMGRGKTWWLIDLAWRAMEQKRRVAFFEIGDLSQNQIMNRFMIRASKRPAKATPVCKYPTFLELPPKSRRAAVTWKKRAFKKPLNWKTAWTAAQAITGEMESAETFLKLSTHANGTIDIRGLIAILESWERQGWNADVIVIDYADLLTPISRGETWDQISETWKVMRGLSQSRHCLLATATQANAQALDAETMTMKHFSGDVRKFAHATGFVGINQTESEKKTGVQRLNWLKVREAYFDTSRPCYCAGCLDIGNTAVKSIF